MAHHFLKENLQPPGDFYTGEGIKLSRENRRRYRNGRCPFHNGKSGKSFSCSMVTGAFTCFSCGVHGSSIVGFVMLRDKCTFKAACQALGAWDESPTPETARRLKAESESRNRLRLLRQAREDEARRQRLMLRDEIHTDARILQEASDRLSELRLGAVPASLNEEEFCWGIMALAHEDLGYCESAYMDEIGLEYIG